MNAKTEQKQQAEQAGEANKIDLRNEIQEEFRSRAVPWFRWVFDHLDLPRGARILELGSGSGTLWQENQNRLPRSWQVTLSDRSRGMLRAARENLDPGRVNGFLCLDGQSLPFPDGSFDAVIAIGVFDLIPNVSQAIRETARVVHPSGQLITSAGGRRHLKEMETLIQPFLPEGKAELLGGDEDQFGLENGAQMLSDAFQHVTRSDYQDRLVFRSIQPILDYVLSEDMIMESMTLQQLSRFLQHLKEHIAQQGQVDVSVQKGLFIARKNSHA